MSDWEIISADDMIDLNFVLSDMVDINITDAEIVEYSTYDALATIGSVSYDGVPIGKQVI